MASITVGGVALDHDMTWEDEHSFTPVIGKEDRTIYGSMVIQSYPLYEGRPITLTGDDSSGWQSRTTVAALKALSEQRTQFNLEIYGLTLPVRFRYSEGAAVEFSPVSLFQPEDEVTEFWFSGTLRMIQVEP